jgi:hypothetical protein
MEASMVTIKLPAQLYTQLQMLATDEQTDPIEILTRLITLAIQERGRLQSPTRAFQRILDRATDLGVTDLAEQNDHYLYGVEKR